MAFYCCSTLTNVTLPESVTSIGDHAFSGCTSLTEIALPDTVRTLGDYAFAYCASVTAISIPAGVTNINFGAFEGCANLASVNIPNGVTTITDEAFWGCTSLTSITIPDSVTMLGEHVFAGCTHLLAITVAVGSSSLSSTEGVLFDKNQTVLLRYPEGKAGGYRVPQSVTRIGTFAFEDCTALARVTIPGRVTCIEYYAFSGCTSLTEAHFEGDVPPQEGERVFNACDVAHIYYRPGTTGWPATFGGRPTAPWIVQADRTSVNLDVQMNRFGFTIIGPTNVTVVVESCRDLVHPAWLPVGTNKLTGGSSHFGDPGWASYGAGFYRLRSP